MKSADMCWRKSTLVNPKLFIPIEWQNVANNCQGLKLNHLWYKNHSGCRQLTDNRNDLDVIRPKSNQSAVSAPTTCFCDMVNGLNTYGIPIALSNFSMRSIRDIFICQLTFSLLDTESWFHSLLIIVLLFHSHWAEVDSNHTSPLAVCSGQD